MRILLLVLFVILATPVKAEETLSTGYYVKACTGTVKGHNSGEQVAHCLGYIRGFMSAATLLQTESGEGAPFCADHLTMGDVRADVLAYVRLDRTPEHVPFHDTLMIALSALYTC